MAGHEESGSPTPSEQDDHEDKDNSIEHEEEGAQENDETMNDQDREPESHINDGEENQNYAQGGVLTEAAMGDENDVVPNPEWDGIQASDEAAQPAQVGSNTDVMMEDPDAGPDLEEELGGVIVGEVEYANGLVDLLVMSIDSSPGTPEL